MGLANDSSPDLIVHGVLGMERSMDQIREEMRGILERLVCVSSLSSHSTSILVQTCGQVFTETPVSFRRREPQCRIERVREDSVLMNSTS